MKCLYRIGVRIRDLNKIIKVYNTTDKKSFIQFNPTGMFSGYVDVIYENFLFTSELQKAGISLSVKPTIECCFVDNDEIDMKNRVTEGEPIEISVEEMSKLIEREGVESVIYNIQIGRYKIMDIEPNDKKNVNHYTKQGIGIDVSEIKLQRMKRVEKQFIDFKLEKRRMKWELIKSLQEEFDKLPDDLEFTSFRAVGIGIGRSIYF